MTERVDTETGERERYGEFSYSEIVRDIRAQSKAKRGAPEACYICGNHRNITQLHHLIPVSEIAKVIQTSGALKHPMPTVWLCPNHHAYWHAIERRSKGEYGQIFMSLSSEETQKLFELKRLMIEILAEYHGISMEELDNL